MNFSCRFLLVVLCLFTLPAFAQDYSHNNRLAPVAPLKLEQAYLIEADFDTQPSGLALCQDKLLLVSDKVDHRIFEVNAQLDGTAGLSPFIKLAAIPGKKPPYPMNQQSKLARLRQLIPGARYDYEGIDCDEDYFYLASETMIDVLRVDKSGQSMWLNTNSYQAGRKHGLYSQPNAYLEAVARMPSGELIIGAERQARGLITLINTGSKWLKEVNTQLATPIKPAAEYRLPDLTGLAIYNDYLYTLERNAHLVCQRTLITYRSVNCWSYAHVENASDIRYQDDKYGLAEGLAISDEYIYIVLDNNGDARWLDEDDRRATLLVFKTPSDIKP